MRRYLIKRIPLSERERNDKRIKFYIFDRFHQHGQEIYRDRLIENPTIVNANENLSKQTVN